MMSLLFFIFVAGMAAYVANQLNDPVVLAKVKKFFRIGTKKAADLAAKKEDDPVKLAEASILELKKDLTESQKSLSEVKALTIRTQKEKDIAEKSCIELETRAMDILLKGKNGELPEAEAERRAVMLLDQREKIMTNVRVGEENIKHYRAMLQKLEANNLKIYEQVSEWENELKTLKARNRMNEASKKMHERLSKMDDSNTQMLIDKMRQNTEEQEILAQAYQEITQPLQTKADDEVDKILGYKSTGAMESLNRLKLKLDESIAKNALENKDLTKKEEKTETPPKNITPADAENQIEKRFEIKKESGNIDKPENPEEKPDVADKKINLTKKSGDPDLDLGM
jgi:phage shock protein A